MWRVWCWIQGLRSRLWPGIEGWVNRWWAGGSRSSACGVKRLFIIEGVGVVGGVGRVVAG